MPQFERKHFLIAGAALLLLIAVGIAVATTGSSDDAKAVNVSFGATLYHVLTNEPPNEARKRFLDTRSLTPPRELNPHLSSTVEKAILWAMSLHPDNRPVNVLDFRDALTGKTETPTKPGVDRSNFDMPQVSIKLLTQAIDNGWICL